MEPVRTSTTAWHILLHQVMALCLEYGGIHKDQPWEILGKSFCFFGLERDGFHQFLDYLLSRVFRHDNGDMLSMGLEAEKVFSQRNFMELYSVFSSPTEFEVIGLSGEVIGSVEWDFLVKLLEEQDTFYLVGQAWSVERIERKNKAIFVTRAPAGKVPKLGGLSPRFTGYELSRRKRDILISTDDYTFLVADAKAWLVAPCADRASFLSTSFAPIEQDEKGILWHTWAGGLVNNTLRYALKMEVGKIGAGSDQDFSTESSIVVQATNQTVRIIGESFSWNEFSQVLEKMEGSSYW